MKLIKSIGRELFLLSRSYYFYVEIAMAVLSLVLLLFIMPENTDLKSTEYYFFDMPEAVYEHLETELFPNDGSIAKEDAVIKNRGRKLDVMHYITDSKNVYVVENEEILKDLCEDSGSIGIKITADGDTLSYHYYLQGYETVRYRNLAKLVSSSDVFLMSQIAERQIVKPLAESISPLTDRQNLLSILLTVNSALMGIFIMSAYIFEDKKTNMINALRVTPTSAGSYLLAKMSAVLFTSLISAMVVAIPIMKTGADYLLLAAVILSSGFFTISAGSLISSFFKDMEGAFAAVFIVLIILLVPAIGYMIPAWNALWLKFIPSYFAIAGTQNALMKTASAETLLYCGGFLIGGIAVFYLSLYCCRDKEAVRI